MHHFVEAPQLTVQYRPRLRGEEVTVQQRKVGILLTVVLGFVLVLALAACSDESGSGEHDGGAESGENSSGSESGEHSSESESGEHGEGSESDEGGEESGTQFGLGDTFDEIRAGARLVLSYDSASNAFKGTVENTTGDTLPRVRVEVHLSNGIELGPTDPVDLAPGQAAEVTLGASSQPFASWSAHPEVG